MARSADATAGAAQAQAARNAAAAQANYLARMQAGAGSRSPDTMEQGARAAGAVAAGQPISSTYRPGEIIGGPDRRTANGGAVVDGVYIPPGTRFGAPTARTSAPATSGTTTVPATGGTGTGGNVGSQPAGRGQGSTSNLDATRQYYADALKFLTDLANRGGQTIGESVARMKADPYNLANAYANLQLAAPTVAANPIAEYAAAAGLSDAQAAAAQQLAAAESAATQQALSNLAETMSTSQQQANLSRLADIGLIETGAQQDLQDRLATMALALKQGELGALTGLQQQNLQNELNMRNAIANQISNVFAGQNVAPESILKLIQETLNRMNMSQWTNIPGMGA